MDRSRQEFSQRNIPYQAQNLADPPHCTLSGGLWLPLFLEKRVFLAIMDVLFLSPGLL